MADSRLSSSPPRMLLESLGMRLGGHMLVCEHSLFSGSQKVNMKKHDSKLNDVQVPIVLTKGKSRL